MFYPQTPFSFLSHAAVRDFYRRAVLETDDAVGRILGPDRRVALVVYVIVSVLVTLVTTAKPEEELRGLVYGLSAVDLSDDAMAGDKKWYRSPVILGTGAIVIAAALYGVIL